MTKMTETELNALLAGITPANEAARAAAHAHWASLAKPLGGLGRLETMLEDAAALTGSAELDLSRRVVVVLDGDENVIELVNPEIVSSSGEQTGLEGCLSLPGYWGEVTRPMKVKVKAQDRSGNEFEVEDEGMVARCFCHEIDHLDGVLFIDRMDKTVKKD